MRHFSTTVLADPHQSVCLRSSRTQGLDQYLEIKEGGRERKRKEGRKEERKKGRRSAFPTGHVLEMRVGGKMIASLV